MYLGYIGDEPSVLDQVVADAEATQAAHGRMLNTMADWELREPGKLHDDAELRNAYIEQLDSLRSQFVDRNLKRVGVLFPMFLNRTDPAHAVILAVRDDIGDTRDRLAANTAQQLIGKQVSAIPRVEQAIYQVATDGAAGVARVVDKLTPNLNKATDDAGEALKKLMENIPWLVGGLGVVGFIVYQLKK